MTNLGTLLASPESEEVEYKETWTDDSLKALAALARKRVPGWHGDGKEQERVSSQIVDVVLPCFHRQEVKGLSFSLAAVRWLTLVFSFGPRWGPLS